MAKSSGLSKKVRRMLADFFSTNLNDVTRWLSNRFRTPRLRRERRLVPTQEDRFNPFHLLLRQTHTDRTHSTKVFFLLPNITDKSIFHNNHSEVPSPSPNLYNRRYDLMSPTLIINAIILSARHQCFVQELNIYSVYRVAYSMRSSQPMIVSSKHKLQSIHQAVGQLLSGVSQWSIT